MRRSKLFLLVGTLCASGLLAFHFPSLPSELASRVLAVVVFAITLWVTEYIDNGTTSVLMMALLVIAGVSPSQVFSGFTSAGFWILVPALFYGLALQKTGLAERICYHILSRSSQSCLGLLGAFFVIGIVLALCVPSTTARVAIVVPIAWRMVEALELGDRSAEGALIVITSIEMAVIPGFAFLYSSLAGPALVSVFKAKNLTLGWFHYSEVAAFPVFLLSAMVVFGNWYKVGRPARLSIHSSWVAKEKLRTFGSISRNEVMTGLAIIGSVALWATEQFHQVPAFTVAMIGVAFLAVVGVLPQQELNTGIPWTLVLFYGGILGLANVFRDSKILEWFTTLLYPAIYPLTRNLVSFVVVVGLLMFLLRFFFQSITFVIPIVFLSLADIAICNGLDPLVIVVPLVLASTPFWFSFQNPWIVMGEDMTSRRAYTSKQRLQLAHVYAVSAILSLVLWAVLLSFGSVFR